PGHIFVHMSPEVLDAWVGGYTQDIAFRNRWREEGASSQSWHPGKRFFKDQRGLLYFRDADFIPRLCVPRSLIAQVLKRAHESPMETAHGG
ncbi:hypothetical protein PUNSTDRAFT_37322, partial [Punctularia strigosozonata HHB-11173 SS5]|uniref:uncharacterized protein n=1 Tax=Punctularia strigosozonata (strain HHB-11173) TaxID=741275 RepID=UPI0004416C5B